MPKIVKLSPKTAAPTPNSRFEAGSVLSQAQPIGFQEDEGIKVLLYGRSGTGKTTLWSTFPGPTLAVICSGGNRPGELRSINTPEMRDKVRQLELRSVGQAVDLCGELAGSERGRGAFATVVLDHASGLQDLVLKELLGLEELPAQKGWGLASQQTYGQCTLQCKEILRKLLNLRANVVVVAQEREFNNDSESDLIKPFVGAGLSPSLTGWLNTAVDYICQTYLRQREEVVKTTLGGKTMEVKQKVKGVEYCLRTGPDPTYTTKFRLPRGRELPETIVDPSYEKIMELING